MRRKHRYKQTHKQIHKQTHTKKHLPEKRLPFYRRKNLRQKFKCAAAATALTIGAAGAAGTVAAQENRPFQPQTVDAPASSALVLHHNRASLTDLEDGFARLHAQNSAVNDDNSLSTIFNKRMREADHAWLSYRWFGMIDRHNREMRRSSENLDIVANWLRGFDDLKDKPRMQQLREVDRRVDNFLTYASDREVYGKADYWATPLDSLKNKRGDCEDFAIMKYFALRWIGVPEDDMRLVAVKMREDKKAGHATLVVKSGGVNYVLDNRSPPGIVRPDSAHTWEYRTVSAMNANGVWRRR
ncbi:MAG: hypothetical protein EA357_11130 [Micavibrio sp.]|nr:MAG: hypothetical protein EA357_11130 [Micavibrio sp.]